MREPLRWYLGLGERCGSGEATDILRQAMIGPRKADWKPPQWLLPHQLGAAQRIAASLDHFGGALLCDAVGLGKTYVALAVADRHETVSLVAPAVLLPQWRRTSSELGIPIRAVSHESLSRGNHVPDADFVIVDEAHRFRNTGTRRYDALARTVRRASLLLLTATPVVNTPRDILSLIRLFLADNKLAAFGLPSLEAAQATCATGELASAIAPLVVARSPVVAGNLEEAMPTTWDAPVAVRSALAPARLESVLRKADSLKFPSFGTPMARELLLLHIHYRLASSAAACAETLSRHRTYLDRAIAAAQQGEPLTRRASRELFGPDDDLQLALDELVYRSHHKALDALPLVAERDRLTQLVHALRDGQDHCPKADWLKRILAARVGKKSIVFTSAIATAFDLAHRMGWKRLAVVTARGAHIASGTVPVTDILDLFAPNSRPGLRCAPVDVLIATDLVSEGLDLQRADAVVHFDLPWTPLKLQQRIGRIARLGSNHAAVQVWWLLPPPSLERRLRIRARIETKVAHQRDLGVSVSSGVGRAHVLGRALEWREQIGRRASGSFVERPCYTVVRGPPAAAFVLQWATEIGSIPTVVVIAGSPPTVVEDLTSACRLMTRLLEADTSARPPDLPVQRELLRTVKKRLGQVGRGPVDTESRRLARILVRSAARAGPERRANHIDLLDAALEELSHGVSVGAHRELRDLLQCGPSWNKLCAWVRHWRTLGTAMPTVSLRAAIFGDGTDSSKK